MSVGASLLPSVASSPYMNTLPPAEPPLIVSTYLPHPTENIHTYDPTLYARQESHPSLPPLHPAHRHDLRATAAHEDYLLKQWSITQDGAALSPAQHIAARTAGAHATHSTEVHAQRASDASFTDSTSTASSDDFYYNNYHCHISSPAGNLSSSVLTSALPSPHVSSPSLIPLSPQHPSSPALTPTTPSIGVEGKSGETITNTSNSTQIDISNAKAENDNYNNISNNNTSNNNNNQKNMITHDSIHLYNKFVNPPDYSKIEESPTISSTTYYRNDARQRKVSLLFLFFVFCFLFFFFFFLFFLFFFLFFLFFCFFVVATNKNK
jgi:hypothetical protein